MEIPDIKAQLTLARVLQYYGLKPDKHQRLCCPFHEDIGVAVVVLIGFSGLVVHLIYIYSDNISINKLL